MAFEALVLAGLLAVQASRPLSLPKLFDAQVAGSSINLLTLLTPSYTAT